MHANRMQALHTHTHHCSSNSLLAGTHTSPATKINICPVAGRAHADGEACACQLHDRETCSPIVLYLHVTVPALRLSSPANPGPELCAYVARWADPMRQLPLGSSALMSCRVDRGEDAQLLVLGQPRPRCSGSCGR